MSCCDTTDWSAPTREPSGRQLSITGRKISRQRLNEVSVHLLSVAVHCEHTPLTSTALGLNHLMINGENWRRSWMLVGAVRTSPRCPPPCFHFLKPAKKQISRFQCTAYICVWAVFSSLKRIRWICIIIVCLYRLKPSDRPNCTYLPTLLFDEGNLFRHFTNGRSQRMSPIASVQFEASTSTICPSPSWLFVLLPSWWWRPLEVGSILF